SSRNYARSSTPPASHNLIGSPENHLGQRGIIVSFRGGPARNHDRSRDHLGSRQNASHTGNRNDAFIRQDRGDHDQIKRQDPTSANGKAGAPTTLLARDHPLPRRQHTRHHGPASLVLELRHPVTRRPA